MFSLVLAADVDASAPGNRVTLENARGKASIARESLTVGTRRGLVECGAVTTLADRRIDRPIRRAVKRRDDRPRLLRAADICPMPKLSD